MKVLKEKKNLEIEIRQRTNKQWSEQLTDSEKIQLKQLGFYSYPKNKLDVIMIFSQMYRQFGINEIYEISPRGIAQVKENEKYSKAIFVYSTRNLYGRKKVDVDIIICWKHDNESIESNLSGVRIINLREQLNK